MDKKTNETNKEKVEEKVKTSASTDIPSKSKGMPVVLIVALGCVGILIVGGIVTAVLGGYLMKTVGKSLVKTAIEKNTGVKINTDKGNENMEITDSKTGTKINIGAQDIPANFPSDFPIYPGSKPSGSLSGGKQSNNGFWLMLTSLDEFSKVESYYASNLKSKGWGGEETLRMGNTVTWEVKKNGLAGSVAVSREKDAKETGIMIILGTNTQNNSNENSSSNDTPPVGE